MTLKGVLCVLDSVHIGVDRTADVLPVQRTCVLKMPSCPYGAFLMDWLLISNAIFYYFM